MALITVTAHIPNSEAAPTITATALSRGGHSVIYDSRICTPKFWAEVADALNLPGDHSLVSFLAKGSATVTEEAERVFQSTHTVGVRCGEKVGEVGGGLQVRAP